MRDMEKFDPMEHIEALNTLRKATIGKYFGEKEFRVLLKTCGLPSNPVFFVEFSKNILTKNNGQYTWRPDKIKSIHFTDLGYAYEQYSARTKSYMNKWRNKKRQCNTLNKAEIDKAVKLLKENGFEIYAPCGECYKKL